jgi:hypothetical protein
VSRGSGCRITGGSKKDGKTWYDDKGREWQRWYCGVDHMDGRASCNVSIPKLTGKTR